MNPILTGAIGGFLAATSVDLDAFVKARTKDKEAQFDWVLAFTRWIQGAIAGAIGGLGIGAMTQ